MQHTTLFLIISLMMIFFTGCSEQQENRAEKAAEKFILNDGQKWQMDEHTRSAIKTIDSLLTADIAFESIDAYKLFAEKLDTELVALIRGCTMEGPAHDQLHIFLGYFYPKIQDLKKEENSEKSQVLVSQMRDLLKEYHIYFE